MSRKNKILVFISSDLYTRNFVLSGALDRLRDHYDLRFALTDDCDQEKLNGRQAMPLRAFGYSKERDKKFYSFTELDMVRLRKKCSTFDIKYRFQLGKKKKALFRLLSLPFIYPFYKLVFMRYMGEQKEIVDILGQVQPDLVIIPTSLVESISVDVVNSCKRRNIKTLMLINGWDNISSKGTIPNMPDYMGVWGQQSKDHAVLLHNIGKERIFALGVPHFERYYQKPTQSREDFRRLNGIPLNKKIILFAGSCRVFDETSALLELEEAIEAGELADVHILYRPHPWRHKRQTESSFYEHRFKHVTIDPDLADSYYRHKTDSDFVNLPSNVLPDLSRYVNLYNAVDGVICTLTTIIVEAAIMGLPVLVIAFSDQKHRLTMDKIIENKHFEDIFKVPGIMVCQNHTSFLSDCGCLLDFIEDEEIRKNLRPSVNYIAYSDNKAYSERLLDAVGEILSV